MNKLKLLSKTLLVVNFTLFFIILSVKLTVNNKQLYYFDINYLNIPNESGFNVTDIKANYNYLINFITSRQNIEFNMPTLPSSSEGKIHFYEVKNIFIKMNLTFWRWFILHKHFYILNRSLLFPKIQRFFSF